MIRIATCGHIRFESGSIDDAFRGCMSELGNPQHELNEFETPVELIDSAAAALNETPYDLVISAFDLKGVTGIHAISELNDFHSYADDLRMVLCASDPNLVSDALQNGANGFLLEPVTQAEFNRVVGGQLAEIAMRNEQSVVVRCRDRMRRIFFRRLSYAETSGHNQVLHHIGNDSSCDVRCSSREAFALLEEDERFFKVGSSYIVNLDYVDSLDCKQGLLMLSDGVEIPVPVRLRKSLKEALSKR